MKLIHYLLAGSLLGVSACSDMKELERNLNSISDLHEGQVVTAYASQYAVRFKNSEIGQFKLTKKVIECIQDGRINWNPDNWDRELLLHPQGSDVFIRIAYSKNKAMFIDVMDRPRENGYLRGVTQAFTPACNLSDLPVLDKLYELPYRWKTDIPID